MIPAHLLVRVFWCWGGCPQRPKGFVRKDPSEGILAAGLPRLKGLNNRGGALNTFIHST